MSCESNIILLGLFSDRVGSGSHSSPLKKRSQDSFFVDPTLVSERAFLHCHEHDELTNETV